MTMNEEQRTILAAVARMLGYPHHSLLDEREEIMRAIDEVAEALDVKQKLSLAFNPLCESSLMELQELYVTTFDMKEDTGLYLTAIELGDSRDRGAALILLQNIMEDAGFVPAYGELADYIPALYELIAASPNNVHVKALKRRLAVATKRIADFLPPEHPYKPSFSILVKEVFGEPSAEDIERLVREREPADLEDMPYPILYGMDGTAVTAAGSSINRMNPCKGMEV